MTSKAGNPFFSIITCTYNSEKFVHNNITSVKQQTFKDYEHLFIDGFSDDNTLNIVNKYVASKKGGKVKLFKYKPKGVANAFNMGIKHSKGKYLIHLNSDDYFFDKNILKDMHNYLQNNPDIDWTYSKVMVINTDGGKLGIFPRWRILQMANVFILKFIDYVPHQSVFIKKEVFDKYGRFDEKVKYVTDYEYWLRVSDKTKWRFVDRTIAYYTAHKDSVSLNRKNKATLRQDTSRYHKRYANVFVHNIFMLLNYSIFTDIYRYFRYFR